MRASPLTVQTNPILLPHQGSAARGARLEEPKEKEKELAPNVSTSNASRRLLNVQDRRDGTMSKGNTKGGKTRMDPATWLSSFRQESVVASRVSSESRPRSVLGQTGFDVYHRRSGSRGRHEEVVRDQESSSSALLDE